MALDLAVTVIISERVLLIVVKVNTMTLIEEHRVLKQRLLPITGIRMPMLFGL
ncbi:hypothetical protein D3C81_2316620 [compost metagenome]